MIFYQLQKKTLITTCLVIATIYILQPHNRSIFNNVYYFLYPKLSLQCYRTKSDTLPDVSDSQPAVGKSIFFHETSCNSHFNGKISITTRQACAVESAARLNPNFQVHLLFASPGVFKFEGSESDRVLQALLTYENVHIHHVDYARYTRGTPVEDLYKSGQVELSLYAQSHASDVLRYLTLWKYGGIYLDLDVVVVKSLESLPRNYAGAESDRNVAAGVLSFGAEGQGHAWAQNCLNDLKDNFKGDDWGYNGPGVITRLLRRLCGAEAASQMQEKPCGGFKVFPKEAFYPVPWWDWNMYFDEDLAYNVFNASKNSYVVHVWNKHSAHRKVKTDGRSAYATYARKFCPRVLAQCGSFF